MPEFLDIGHRRGKGYFGPEVIFDADKTPNPMNQAIADELFKDPNEGAGEKLKSLNEGMEEYWVNYSAEMGERQNKLFDFGAEIITLGINDPLSSTHPTALEFQKQYNKFNADAKLSKQLKQEYDRDIANVNDPNRSKLYTKQSIEDWKNFWTDNSFDKILKDQLRPPTLVPEEEYVDYNKKIKEAATGLFGSNADAPIEDIVAGVKAFSADKKIATNGYLQETLKKQIAANPEKYEALMTLHGFENPIQAVNFENYSAYQKEYSVDWATKIQKGIAIAGTKTSKTETPTGGTASVTETSVRVKAGAAKGAAEALLATDNDYNDYIKKYRKNFDADEKLSGKGLYDAAVEDLEEKIRNGVNTSYTKEINFDTDKTTMAGYGYNQNLQDAQADLYHKVLTGQLNGVPVLETQIINGQEVELPVMEKVLVNGQEIYRIKLQTDNKGNIIPLTPEQKKKAQKAASDYAAGVKGIGGMGPDQQIQGVNLNPNYSPTGVVDFGEMLDPEGEFKTAKDVGNYIIINSSTVQKKTVKIGGKSGEDGNLTQAKNMAGATDSETTTTTTSQVLVDPTTRAVKLENYTPSFSRNIINAKNHERLKNKQLPDDFSRIFFEAIGTNQKTQKTDKAGKTQKTAKKKGNEASTIIEKGKKRTKTTNNKKRIKTTNDKERNKNSGNNPKWENKK